MNDKAIFYYTDKQCTLIHTEMLIILQIQHFAKYCQINNHT